MKIPWVYGIQSGIFIKVGSAANISARMRVLQLGNPAPLKLVLRRQCDQARWLELRVHKLLADCSIGREWFRADLVTVQAAMATALDDLAERRRQQVAWEIKRGGGPDVEKLASWNGRGACRPHPATIPATRIRGQGVDFPRLIKKA